MYPEQKYLMILATFNAITANFVYFEIGFWAASAFSMLVCLTIFVAYLSNPENVLQELTSIIHD